MKICNKCNIKLIGDNYYHYRKTICKKCHNLVTQQIASKNRQYHINYTNKWREKNPGAAAEYQRLYRLRKKNIIPSHS